MIEDVAQTLESVNSNLTILNTCIHTLKFGEPSLSEQHLMFFDMTRAARNIRQVNEELTSALQELIERQISEKMNRAKVRR